MTTSTGTTENVGQIISWKILVAVEIPSKLNPKTYGKLLGADCTSTLSGTAVLPCSSAPAGGGTYAVWERLPSDAVPAAHSGYWVTNAANKEFNQLYTTYSSRYITTVPAASYPVQYYQCNN
jgi:hypothetical protein